jgi:hypothetical protein
LDAARAALEAVGKQWGSEAFEGYLRVMEKSMGPMSWFRGGRRV